MPSPLTSRRRRRRRQPCRLFVSSGRPPGKLPRWIGRARFTAGGRAPTFRARRTRVVDPDRKYFLRRATDIGRLNRNRPGYWPMRGPRLPIGGRGTVVSPKMFTVSTTATAVDLFLPPTSPYIPITVSSSTPLSLTSSALTSVL